MSVVPANPAMTRVVGDQFSWATSGAIPGRRAPPCIDGTWPRDL
jgi:hypothetical protein